MEQLAKAIETDQAEKVFEGVMKVVLLMAGSIFIIGFVLGMATCGCCALTFYLIKNTRSKPFNRPSQEHSLVELNEMNIELEPQAEESNLEESNF